MKNALRQFFKASLPKKPDLRALVLKHGGFSRVPPEIWLAFDKRVMAYKNAVRRRDA
jgi:hypothetical protein